MRKDTRIGVAIGLVLFAVLIVYAVVAPKTPKKKVTLDKIGTAVAPADDSSARGGSLSATGEAAGSGSAAADTTGATEAPTTEVDEAKSMARWTAILSAKEKLEDTFVTHTPPVDKPDTSAPVRPVKVADTISPGPGDFATPREHSATSSATTHRVQQGETFISIARAYYRDGRYVAVITKANPGIDPRRLRPGTTINLPAKVQALSEGTAVTAAAKVAHSPVSPVVAPDEYTVQSDDNLYKISMRFFKRGDKANAIYELNRNVIGPDSSRLRPGMVLKLPVVSRVSTASAVAMQNK